MNEQINKEQRSSESSSQGQSNPSKICSIWWFFSFTDSFVNSFDDWFVFWDAWQEVESIAKNDVHFFWSQWALALDLLSVESLKSNFSSMTQNKWCLK